MQLASTQPFLGVSPAVRQLRDDVEYAARTDAKVLITGESGVGKEILARLLHGHSRRAHASLYTINCAGLPDTLLESELFGHVRGSFTDAYRDKRGWLELAHGGTVFLDEVGEMSLRMQALLLRFLESGEIQPLGSERRRNAVDVRVIAATNRNLADRIAAKEFREDLYYRLNVVHLVIPPLRERPEDVPVLLERYLQVFSDAHKLTRPQLSAEALAALQAYRWPGNVRELKNVVERLVIRSTGHVIGPDDLQLETWDAVADRAGGAPVEQPAPAVQLFERMAREGESFWTAVYEPFMARDLTREDLRLVVRMALEQTRGNYKAVVRLLNMQGRDYKRFLRFLANYECHASFQPFRMSKATGGCGVREMATHSGGKA